jgi:hypothetical protein
MNLYNKCYVLELSCRSCRSRGSDQQLLLHYASHSSSNFDVWSLRGSWTQTLARVSFVQQAHLVCDSDSESLNEHIQCVYKYAATLVLTAVSSCCTLVPSCICIRQTAVWWVTQQQQVHVTPCQAHSNYGAAAYTLAGSTYYKQYM